MDQIQMQSDLEGASVEDKEEGSKSPKPSIESYKMSLDALDSGLGQHVADDVDDKSTRSPSNQLVPYNAEKDTLVVTGHTKDRAPLKKILGQCPSSRTLPSIGAFTIQCAQCFKWRIIPSKEKYEALREHIIEEPFVCEQACEWRPDISCEDPTDLSQDGTRIWAIDKPNIARPPPGWERLLRIRGEGSTKFADVYYAAPSGKRFRSMVEVQKYLLEHPEYVEQGVSLSQFSFQTPRPLQENYVRKRPARLMSSGEGGPPEPEEVKPLAWVAPTLGESEAARSDSSAFCDGKPANANSSDQLQPPAAKKKFQGPSTKQMYNNSTNHIGDHLVINLEYSEQSRSAPHDI